MKKKLLFGLLCLLSVTTFVNAEENNKNVAPWNTILKNGVLEVNAPRPTEENTEKVKVQVQQQINEQYKKEIEGASTRHQGEDYIIVEGYYIDYTDLKYVSCEFEGECDFVPVTVPIKWQETEYSEAFKKIAPNGVFTINRIKPTKKEFYYYYKPFIASFDSKTLYGAFHWCNDDYSQCELGFSEYDSNQTESHTVNVVWQEEDPTIKKIVDQAIEKINTVTDRVFNVTDLNLVNYFAHKTQFDKDFHAVNSSINYSNDLKKITEDSNISYYLGAMMGADDPLNSFGAGGLTLYYNGIAYGMIEEMVYNCHQNVIYIPDDTQNTSDAYIAAAKKRIDAYLGNSDTKVEVGGKRSEFASDYDDSEFDFSIFGDESKMGDYYYLITINEEQYPFVIMRDSSKIETPVVEKVDRNTNISVSTESASVPLDASLKVEEVTKESLFFKGVAKELLKIKDEEEVQIYDFTLFSESLNQNITRLDSGEFKVSVPVKESLRGKKLVAYYITEDNKIEEHPVTEKDGMGTFTTNHFSVYTIAEARKMENGVVVEVPKTYDGIMNSIILGVVGLVGLSATIVVMKKKEN